MTDDHRDDPVAAPRRAVEPDGTARGRILELIATDGPVSAADLATRLGVTPAAVRRHLGALEDDGLVAVHEPTHHARMRGRPARHYVTTARGQAELSGGYAEIASGALRFLREAVGESAVERFAAARFAELGARYAPLVDAADVAGRAAQLADALALDGYAATVRPVPGGLAVQVCQGHCPVQHVAAEFPQLCEAEAEAFSRLLGTHVQRLATLATGAHTCTTNVPIRPLRPDHAQAPAAERSRGPRRRTVDGMR